MRVPTTWKKRIAIGLGVLVALAAGAGAIYLLESTHHSAPTQAPRAVAASGDAVLDAIRRGIAFLEVHQEEDGEFSKGLLDPKPAFTALVVDAMVKSPDGPRYATSDSVRRACDAIVSHQQPDGGIYTPAFGLGNYCTSIAVMALKTAGENRHEQAIEKALGYVRASQLGEGTGSHRGGFGYGAGTGEADLSNTLQSLEALRQAGAGSDDPAIRAAIEFVTRCQNHSETNDSAWASSDGGFVYRPANSKAGTYVDESGKVGYRSYGLMSYAGLMSLLHAYVDKSDARVVAAVRWVSEHYNLDENVALGPHGLYYYYLVMAKALDAHGERWITTSDGVRHDWAAELSAAIVRRQRGDGSWTNVDSQRWMEDDAVLVTAYMVRALTHCHAALARHAAADAVRR